MLDGSVYRNGLNSFMEDMLDGSGYCNGLNFATAVTMRYLLLNRKT